MENRIDMREKRSVCAVIVTYNKIDLLRECIAAVKKQSREVEHILVVDNNSTDGTLDFLKNEEGVDAVHMDRNIGGAGGFSTGIQKFISIRADSYCWIMDDDTIPNKDCLMELLNAEANLDNVGFLASNVRWTDNNPAVMNVPKTAIGWNERASEGLIKIERASFVSILVSREAIEKIGLPIAEFFIWGDDVEYTLRITKAGFNNYFVSNSMVLHKMKENIGIDIIKETNSNRINRYYVGNRNAIYTNRKLLGFKGVMKELLKHIILIPKILFKKNDKKLYKIFIVIKGTVVGFFFNPKIKYVK
ncbi:glycosyltransferase family 2 protein [Pediococcus pentosaceus]|uniref:glycosyltransferase family 2 protein n=1 Tax=Pediococcus pentosaceus TaxID=1255 RepID=UPI00223A81C7|nr:glycosyltransferase family 2 protein [Pediococcus pentosaceus]